MIYFIRHGKPLLPYKSHGEMPFSVLAALASGELNPQVDVDITVKLIADSASTIPLQRIERIFCSPSRRCQETAFLVADYCALVFQKGMATSVLSPLREINFDLRRICATTDCALQDLSEINSSVFAAMAKGNYCEHAEHAYKRVFLIFKMLSQIPDGEFLFVTHDFFMRVIEIFIRNRGKNKNVTFDDLKNTKRNMYAGGFLTNRDMSVFLPF